MSDVKCKQQEHPGVFPAETHMPCKVHPQGLLSHSFLHSHRMLTLLGPFGCPGSDKSPPSGYNSQGSSAIKSQVCNQHHDRGTRRMRESVKAGGPDAVEGQSRLPRGGAIPAEPGSKCLSWEGLSWAAKVLRASAWGSLPGGPLSSRCSLVCRNPQLCCLLPPPSVHSPSKALWTRGLF